ncbi:ABC transporter ATP-binding protein [Bradyrhizobium sp. B120]|uniref:ABC transporter ATP-binding protein n=1 Tax=Bradyrhizobium sp. B120 TaxID=3410088 RepID=UPI003B9806FD
MTPALASPSALLGCGKSTLLKAIGGYLHPAEGSIRLAGREIAKPGPDRMMVFQEFDQLFPWLTVTQNVAFALTNGVGMSRELAIKKARDFVGRVGLSQFADAFPHALSGGMKARVAIARGMAVEPEILLMDEPFAALDALTRAQMQDDLLLLCRQTKTTIIFVTHSISEAIKLGNRILLLSPHPGRVKAELGGDGKDDIDPSSGLKKSEKIHRLLFSEDRRAEVD